MNQLQNQYGEVIVKMVDGALNEINLNEEGLKRLLTHEEELQAYITAGVRRFSAIAPKNGELARVPGLFHEWHPAPHWCVQDNHS